MQGEGTQRPELRTAAPAHAGVLGGNARAARPGWWAGRASRGIAGALGRAFGLALVRELDDRRGFLFAVIGFGIGVALYFGAEREPVPFAAAVPAMLFASMAWLARRRPAAFYGFALLAAISCGFATASFQVQRIAHPVLAETLTAVKVSGFVEAREKRMRGSRITLRVTGIERAQQLAPERVRVTLSSREAPTVGSHVTLRATLSPPPGASWPGGFDFGRASWFDGIGATGFALGKAEASAAPGPVPLSLQVARWLDERRQDMAARITATLPGAAGGIAVALVTGLRDAVPEPIEESMRVSGLSHVLSISGLHMALVATTVFFLVRALLALFPPLALHYPIKSWAAVPAALAATYYLLLSGAEVPTQRSYVMTLLVLAGVMAGRPALTLRTLALAALAMLVLTPWAILDPGAQMSFAATLALVAAYERFGERLTAPVGQVAGKVAGGGLTAIPARYVAALVLTSLAAGFATAPYAAFHFHRLAPMSLLANLAAMPLVSFIIMPAGLIGCLLMPFGWDGPVWQIMGWGIDGMVAVSSAVAAIPGADSGIRAMPMASMVLLSVAVIVLCLARTWLMILAPLAFAGALWLGWRAPLPDILVDSQARTVAVLGADGRLHVMGDRDTRLEQRFAVEQWRSMAGEQGRANAASGEGARGAGSPGEASLAEFSPAAAKAPSNRERAGVTAAASGATGDAASRRKASGAATPSSPHAPRVATSSGAALGDLIPDMVALDGRVPEARTEARASSRNVKLTPETSGSRASGNVELERIGRNDAASGSDASNEPLRLKIDSAQNSGAQNAGVENISAKTASIKPVSTKPIPAKPASDPHGALCDTEGCTLRTAGGNIVALSRSVASLEDDCRLASVVVTTIPPPENCSAEVVVVDPRRQIGGLAVYARRDGGWQTERARPSEPMRLWHPGFYAATDANARAVVTPVTEATADTVLTSQAVDMEEPLSEPAQ